jgi:DNA-binding protein WhiA
MSFSSEVKEELAKQLSKSRHCQLAELAGLIHFAGKIVVKDGSTNLEIVSEHAAIVKKCYTLIKKAFHITLAIETHGNFTLVVSTKEDVMLILKAMKILDASGMPQGQPDLVDGLLIQNACCKRAFIRGSFLAAGSMSDPQKSYHFEIVCTTKNQAEQLRAILSEFVEDAKIVLRKKYYVVYIKEGSQIVDALNVMEAHTALMNLENVRILKEMRNTVNRKVNCETANINKTVNAAVKQMEDIRYIQEKAGLGILPDTLREMAELRLEYPDAPLKELGDYLNPPVGKSGVNHRLRKISAIAEDLRR